MASEIPFEGDAPVEEEQERRYAPVRRTKYSTMLEMMMEQRRQAMQRLARQYAVWEQLHPPINPIVHRSVRAAISFAQRSA